MIRIGIAGLGFMGMTHFHAIKKIRGLRVDAIATRDAKKRKGDWTGIQGNFGPRGGHEDLRKVRTYADLKEMLGDPDLDLIDITLPTEYHLDGTLAALKAGRHVLVEKPIAEDLKEGEKMVAAARRARRKLLVAHVLPFFPEFAEAIRIVRSGRYGKVQGAHLKRIISLPDLSKTAGTDWPACGMAIDLHIHDTHFIQALFGKPKAVFARGREVNGKVEFLTTQYLYKDTQLAISCLSGALTASGRPFTHGFEIFMEKATLLFEWSNLGGEARAPMPLTLVDHKGKARPRKTKGGDPLLAFESELKYARDTLNGLHSGELLSGEGALAALKLCHREIRSVRSGRVVPI